MPVCTCARVRKCGWVCACARGRIYVCVHGRVRTCECVCVCVLADPEAVPDMHRRSMPWYTHIRAHARARAHAYRQACAFRAL